MRRAILLYVSLFICTFAAAKAVIALAVSYQYAEKERFSFSKGEVG
jgi:hypothetical protein